ncbi:nuclease-related domain-containing protein [Carnobacteriaceae bacterium 52-44]
MNLQQMEFSRDSNKLSSLLDFTRISHRRQLIDPKEGEYTLYRLEMGELGEQRVLNFIKKYGNKHWIVIRNLWMDYYGSYESDIILMTKHAIYVFEVKNYEGNFEYEDGQCRINGNLYGSNCVFQAERAHINLQNICRKISPSIPVKGALIFIGEHNQVSIHSKVNNIQIIMRNQLRDYIRQIAKDEAMSKTTPINVQKMIKKFEELEIINPYGPKAFQPSELTKAKKGICCAKCGSFSLEISKLFVRCSCGFQELRKEAMLRTIHKYGALIFETDEMRTSVI